MRDYFYNNVIRLDWGFGNPNITGSLIAMIMLAVWGLAYLPFGWGGKAGFWTGLTLNVVLGICLIQTFSRGAVVAFLVGAVILVAYAPRPWRHKRLVAVLLVVVGLIFYSFNIGFSERTMHGLSGEDQSITNRWLIYKVIPRMAWDAPEGWGHARGAEAFRQWYQPIGRTETYGRLVNSHATWLVEWPWYLRLGYGVAWTALILLCTPVVGMRFSPSLAVWVSFGVGACFTTIAHHWLLWIIPGLSFFLILLVRICLKSWPVRRHVKIAGGALALSIATWWIWALCIPSHIKLAKGVVVVSDRDPQTNVLVLGVDETVMGKFYGHRIRERCATERLQLFMLWTPIETSWPNADICVLAGSVARKIVIEDNFSRTKIKRWLLLNPDQPSVSLLKLMDVEVPPSVTIRVGSLAGGDGRYVWQTLATKHPAQIKFEEIAGRARFLREWSQSSF